MVVIDAGHGGSDPGAVYAGRREKDDNLEIALAVGELLTERGVDVIYTRTTDVYDSPIRKAQIANESGADYFISIHRNSSANPGQYNGVQTLLYDNNGIKSALAENINSELEEAGYRNLGISERQNLAVLRRTQMPAVLVEVGFINSDIDNQLLDSNFNETVQAIADGILNTIGQNGTDNVYNTNTGNAATGSFTVGNTAAENTATGNTAAGNTVTSNTVIGNSAAGSFSTRNPVVRDTMMRNGSMSYSGINSPSATESSNYNTSFGNNNNQSESDRENQYTIQVGLFARQNNAELLASQLRMLGIPVTITKSGELYSVRAESFDSIDDAQRFEQDLKMMGYETLLLQTE